MAIKDLRKSEKRLIGLTAVILASVLLFTTIIDPQLKTHKALANQLVQLQMDLVKAKTNLMIRDRIEKAYSAIEPLIAIKGSSQQQISDFTRLLDQLYSTLNVKIRSVKILPETNSDYYRKLSVRIEMTGHVKDILEFITAVEQHTDPIRIEQFDLASQEIRDVVMISMAISKIVSIENETSGTNDKKKI